MVINPREENVDPKARRARALHFPFPRVNNHIVMDTEDFIPMKIIAKIQRYLWPPLPGDIECDIARVILPRIWLQPL